MVPVHQIKVNSKNSTQTLKMGELLGNLLQPHHIICLDGPLGAGKTTLVRGIALGWQAIDRVTSPTYTIVNVYRHRQQPRLRLFHIDAYRLDSDAAIESIGLSDLLDGNGPGVIEWASKVGAWLPTDVLQIALTVDEEALELRQVNVVAGGTQHLLLLDALATQLESLE